MAGSKPHILLVGGDGYPSGVPQHITDLARGLQGMSRVSVLSEIDQGGYAGLAAFGARHIQRPGLASRIRHTSLRMGWRNLLQTLQQEKPDIVWLHARLPVILGRQAIATGAWQPGATRVAVTFHGLPFGSGHRPLSSTLSRYLERYLLRRCSPLELVCLTGAQAALMSDAMGRDMAKHRMHVLGNASSLGALPVPAHRPAGRHLVMTGRAGWQKNYSYALRLMRHLPDDVHLSLCGFGTDTPAFAAQVRRFAGPAADRVTTLGPQPDIRPLLAAADGYVLTSRYEGLPIGALEASEAGLPLILADFEGAQELITNHPMSVCLAANPALAAQQVDKLLDRYLMDRPVYAAAIGAHWAERFSPEVFDTSARQLVSGWLAPGA